MTCQLIQNQLFLKKFLVQICQIGEISKISKSVKKMSIVLLVHKNINISGEQISLTCVHSYIFNVVVHNLYLFTCSLSFQAMKFLICVLFCLVVLNCTEHAFYNWLNRNVWIFFITGWFGNSFGMVPPSGLQCRWHGTNIKHSNFLFPSFFLRKSKFSHLLGWFPSLFCGDHGSPNNHETFIFSHLLGWSLFHRGHAIFIVEEDSFETWILAYGDEPPKASTPTFNKINFWNIYFCF